MKPNEFFSMLKQHVPSTDVPAAFILAQAALESAWGESKLATLGMNLFGVKADRAWTGDTLELPTREFLKGKWVTVNAKWRKYSTWSECLSDHAHFLKSNPRYSKAFATRTACAFAEAVAKAGYATDPQYSEKIRAIINKYKLEAL